MQYIMSYHNRQKDAQPAQEGQVAHAAGSHLVSAGVAVVPEHVLA